MTARLPVRRALGALLVGAVALGAAACSGDSSSSSPLPSTTGGASSSTIATSTTAARSADRTADARLAREMVLPASAVPGWQTTAAPDDRAGQAALERLCPNLAAARTRLERAEGGALPSASVAYLADARGLPLVRSKVYVLADAPLAMRVFELASTDAYARCVARAFTVANRQGAANAITYGKPRVSAIGVRRVGDERSGWLITVATTSRGTTFDLHLDLVAIRRGRAVHVLVIGDADALPLAAATRARILAAAGQLAQAGAS
jgi:hypothetical protein